MMFLLFIFPFRTYAREDAWLLSQHTHKSLLLSFARVFFSVRAVPCFEFLISSPAAPAELLEGTGLSLTGGESREFGSGLA